MQEAEVLRLGLLIAGWARREGKKVLFSWLGGEPFLWPGLLPTSRRLRATGVSTSVTTNGRALVHGRLNLSDITDIFSELTFSIDGRGNVHDESRGELGLYDRLLGKIADLSAAAPELLLRANILLTKRSLPDLVGIVRDCAAGGVREVSFNALWVEEGHPLASIKLSPEDVELFRCCLASLRRSLSGRCHLLGATEYVNRLSAYARGHPVPIRECNPGARTLFIDSMGKVAPCAYTNREYGIDSSEIRAIDDVALLEKTFRLSRAASRARACNDCPDTNVFGKFKVISTCKSAQSTPS